MILWESFRSGWQSIVANRLRSGLTMLGIMIGVAAVITLVAFGQGASNSVSASIQSLGTNLLTVFPQDPNRDGEIINPAPRDLTVDDALALADTTRAPDIAGVAPVKSAPVSCTHADRSYRTTINGTWPSYYAINNSELAQGTYFQNADVLDARRVVSLGTTVAEELFGEEDPIGAQVVCNGVPFTVTGILAAKGSTGPFNNDDVILAPLTAVENSLVGYGPLDTISVQGIGPERIDAAEAQVIEILDDRHGTNEVTRDYDIFNQANLLDTIDQALGIFTALLGAVAAISLLVGGIGITNIMLVSVTERTREIGIRKAVGATRRHILLQFLLEATVLSLIGAAAGLLLAFGASFIEIADIRPSIVPASVVAAFVISVAIGLFFGSFPANRAASLRPIEALRHE
jgi:putative ABC transport system permease protein